MRGKLESTISWKVGEPARADKCAEELKRLSIHARSTGGTVTVPLGLNSPLFEQACRTVEGYRSGASSNPAIQGPTAKK